MPALTRVEIPGRDPQRELRLEYVQLRELTRHVRLEIDTGARMADVLGFVQNLERRLAAHEAEMENVYYPAAARVLTPEERRVLKEAAPPD